MKFTRSVSALAVFLLAASVGVPQASGSSSSRVAQIGGPQENDFPFLLHRTITIVQTVADGTTITRTFTIETARDSKDRTFSETRQTLHVRADGKPVDLVTYSVFDPDARTRISWDSRTKIASVTHMPLPKLPDVDATQHPRVGRPTQHQTRVDLGVRTIAGIETEGTRATGVIPTGDQGNDRPLTIVTEKWMSTKYHIPFLTIVDDPRTGKRTDEVTEFQPGEPDPALFQIPKGYTVREGVTGQTD